MNFIQIVICTIFIAIFASFVRWLWQIRKFNNIIDKLPGFGRLFLIGNCGWVFKTYTTHPNPPVALAQRAMACDKLFEKEGCIAFNFFLWRLVNISSPDWVEQLLGSSVSVEKSFEYSFLHKWLGLGLLTSSGEKWRSRRKLLTPSFHLSILSEFLPIFNEQSMVMVRKLHSIADKEYVDIAKLIVSCTLDIVCETVMGHRIGAQEGGNSDYVTALHNLGKFFTERTVSPWLWSDKFLWMTKTGREYEKNVEILHSFTRKVICGKKESMLKKSTDTGNNDKEELHGKKRMAFMDLLLHMHLQGEKLTLKDIQEEVDTFMFGGHDTITTALLFAFYCIGLYPDVQKKVYDEIQSIFGDDRKRHITMEDIRKMKYLECTLKEAQRVYPAVPIIGRKLKENLHCNGLTIPSGTTVHCSIVSLHRYSESFPNPEVFDPDRFLPENSLKRHPYSYVPFSAGPRNCIGQKFGFLEEKVVFANVLRNFEIISLDPRDKIHLKIEFTLVPAEPIRLKFLPRA